MSQDPQIFEGWSKTGIIGPCCEGRACGCFRGAGNTFYCLMVFNIILIILAKALISDGLAAIFGIIMGLAGFYLLLNCAFAGCAGKIQDNKIIQKLSILYISGKIAQKQKQQAINNPYHQWTQDVQVKQYWQKGNQTWTETYTKTKFYSAGVQAGDGLACFGCGAYCLAGPFAVVQMGSVPFICCCKCCQQYQRKDPRQSITVQLQNSYMPNMNPVYPTNPTIPTYPAYPVNTGKPLIIIKK